MNNIPSVDLALSHYYGFDGIEQSTDIAHGILKSIFDAGECSENDEYQKSCFLLGKMHEEGDGLEVNLQQAREYYEFGAEAGHFFCNFGLSSVFRKLKNYQESESFLIKFCNSIVRFDDEYDLDAIYGIEFLHIYQSTCFIIAMNYINNDMAVLKPNEYSIINLPLEFEEFCINRKDKIIEVAENLQKHHPDIAEKLEYVIDYLSPEKVADEVDSQACKEMVEEYWRNFLNFAVMGSKELGEQCVYDFEKRIEKISLNMTPAKRKVFVQIINDERDAIAEEYRRNPDGLKIRLGVYSVRQEVQQVCIRGRQPLGLGEVAARTVVRATVWEGVKSIFKLFK